MSRCQTSGRPRDHKLDRAEDSDFRRLVGIATSGQGVLRRQVESAQHLSIKYTERLAEAGIKPSVGSVGDSYDNTLSETTNGLFKAEVIHHRGPWSSFAAVKYATHEWPYGDAAIAKWLKGRLLQQPPPARAHPEYPARKS